MSVSQTIEQNLTAYLAGPPNELQSVAAVYRALPVYSDIGGTLFITPDLEILALGSDGGASPIPEASEQLRLVALVSAATKYPGLEALLPTRPPDAVDCASCEGNGRIKTLSAVCGECCGLSWRSLHSNNSLESDSRENAPASS